MLNSCHFIININIIFFMYVVSKSLFNSEEFYNLFKSKVLTIKMVIKILTIIYILR